MQSDPVGYKDDLDLYTYVGNDPLDKTDPSGNDGEFFNYSPGGSSGSVISTGRPTMWEMRLGVHTKLGKPCSEAVRRRPWAAALVPAVGEVAGPVSLGLTGIAMVDTAVHDKKFDLSETFVTALTAIPGVHAIGEAIGGIGKLLKIGQEFLHAGATAAAAAAAVLRTQQAAAAQGPPKPPQPTPTPHCEPGGNAMSGAPPACP